MKNSFTKQELNWVLYDVGNSAFTLLVSTIMPLYFNSLAAAGGVSEVDYLAWWGYAASISTALVAVLGPIVGTATDNQGYRKPIFTTFVIVGALLCISLGFAKQWVLFLILYIIAKSAYSVSLVIYDSMLNDVTTEERLSDVSSQGYAWGYIGSCIPFILCLVLVLAGGSFGISTGTAMMLSFVITAVWWVVFTLPLLKTYRQKNFVSKENRLALTDSFRRIGKTLSHIRDQKGVFLFLLAFFFYIDGVYTIIDMATAYGSALGLDSTALLLALLVTQIVAFPFAILFGKIATKYKTSTLITVCIIAYLGIALFAITLAQEWQFWVLAVCVGMFQGGIQALSRAYFTRIIPAEESGEYFGLYDICGKGAAFLGTTIVSVVSQLTDSAQLGVGAISLMFVVGAVLFRKAAKANSDKIL